MSLLACASVPAEAVVFTSQLAATLPGEFSGVARLTNGSTLCSGSLLADGIHFATAAHCVAGGDTSNFSVNFEFDLGNTVMGTQALGVASMILHPGWDLNLSTTANIIRGVDFALLRLSGPVDSRVQRYDINRDPNAYAAGTPVFITGYGQSGINQNNLASGTRRAGSNTIHGSWAIGGACDGGFNAIDPGLAPICTVLPANSPTNVAISAFGDSGGGLFLNGNILAGINSFVSCPGVCDPGNPNSIVPGTAAGAFRIAGAAAFIDGVIGAPEPGAVFLLGGGLLVLAASHSRKRAN